MTYKDVEDVIASVGLPHAYYQFTKQTALPPPFICYYYDGSDDLEADNTNYKKIRPLVIELYTDKKDFNLEMSVENVLNTNGFVFTRAETPIDTEQMYMVVFRTTAVIEQEA